MSAAGPNPPSAQEKSVNQTDQSNTRVAIVGAGPIGLELAAALTRQRIEHCIIEAGQIGETMSWWAPGTRWFSSNQRIAIAGIPLETPDQSKATREQYLTYLRAVVRQYELKVRTFERAVALEHHGESMTLVTESNAGRRSVRCEALVLAVGGTHFARPLGVKGEDLPHVDGVLREPHRYFGRRVLVVGGRNSAIEAALRLHHAGAEVVISYRGAELPREKIKYWLLPEIEGLIRSEQIQAHFHTDVVRITPSTVTLRRRDWQESEPEQFDVPADDVLALIGYEQDKRLFEAAGVELIGPNRRPVFDDATMQTNVPGVYVAGTAVAGTQASAYSVFLENCHEHVDRIVRSLQGAGGGGHPPRPDALSDRLAQQIEAQPES